MVFVMKSGQVAHSQFCALRAVCAGAPSYWKMNPVGSRRYSKDFVILACTVLIQITSVTDGQTDRQTDRRPDDGKDARSILLSRVKTELFDIVFSKREQ